MNVYGYVDLTVYKLNNNDFNEPVSTKLAFFSGSKVL
jgi:hypothetical protein